MRPGLEPGRGALTRLDRVSVSSYSVYRITCDCWDSGLVRYSGGSSAGPGAGALPSAFLRGGEREGWLVRKRDLGGKQPIKSEENRLPETPTHTPTQTQQTSL